MSEEQVARLLQQISGLHETLDKSFRHFKEAQESGAEFDMYKLEEAADMYWQLRRTMDSLVTTENTGGSSSGGIDLDFV